MVQTTEMYFLTVLETRSPRSRCCQGWLLWDLSSWLTDSHLLSVFTWPLLCGHVERRRAISRVSSSSKDTSPAGLGPLWTHWALVIYFKALSPSIVILGVRASICGFQGDGVQPVTGRTWGEASTTFCCLPRMREALDAVCTGQWPRAGSVAEEGGECSGGEGKMPSSTWQRPPMAGLLPTSSSSLVFLHTPSCSWVSFVGLCAHTRDCLQCLSLLPCHLSPVQPRAPILFYPLEFIWSISFSRKSSQMSSWLQGPTISQTAPACTHTPLLTALPSLQCNCVFMSTSTTRLLRLLRARPVSCHLEQTGSLLSIHSPHHRIHSLCHHRGFMLDKQTSLLLHFWVGHVICSG